MTNLQIIGCLVVPYLGDVLKLVTVTVGDIGNPIKMI